MPFLGVVDLAADEYVSGCGAEGTGFCHCRFVDAKLEER